VQRIASDYRDRIRQLRARLGLSQKRLAELLGVSFASVNRWENGQTRPNRLAWSQILKLEMEGTADSGKPPSIDDNLMGEPYRVAEEKVAYGLSDELAKAHEPNEVDFTAPPETVRLVVEAERLAYGHLFSPAFATETSLIDPLPHQRIAVYDYMIPQPRLRFLLADDAGAGKTIMAGLYIREMLTRRLIRRVLIVPPAGLVGNWRRELGKLFNLSFKIVIGADSRAGNPFIGPRSDLAIVSVDTLCSAPTFARLRDPAMEPYDLVVFDEAHKLSADRNPDFTVRKTDRYRLAEAIAGASDDPDWVLPWSCHHLLLLTATPHMGKDFPYFCLWRLLEPEALGTIDAFNAYPPEARRRHFIRRTKEELVRFDGTPIYPKRESHTLIYDLGPAEQHLYDEITSYIRTYYNRARILNRSAARLAMSVFQRRLASSTYAVLRSLERRLEKIDRLIEDIRSGRLTEDELIAFQGRIGRMTDVFERMTADEEEPEEGREQNEVAEDQLLGGVVATSLAELQVEREEVEDLITLAHHVLASGEEAKFEKLREVLQDKQFQGEKMLIFTEHRDTLDFLVRRLEGLGYAGRIALIHGGMDYQERETQVEFFRKLAREGGADLMVATDAAGEGINLQFCWLMVNYDIPWNPARLEQRMGRIHRYKQMHNPVLIFNLVTGKTREGKVLKTLLEKLEDIRRELGSDKVFDVIGMQFEGVSLRDLILQAAVEEREEDAVQQVAGRLTPGQFKARLEQREKLLGSGGDVALHLPEQRAKLERETLRRLIPGYVRRFIERSAPLLHIGVEGNLEGYFSFRALRPGALDALWPILESYDPAMWERLTVYKPAEGEPAIFLHPGEPLFDRYCSLVRGWFAELARRGGVFVDPYAQLPYFFHVALLRVVRRADPTLPEVFGREEPVEVRLVGLRQDETGAIQECPVEHLMLLRGAEGIPPSAIPFVSTAIAACEQAKNFVRERIAEPLAAGRRRALEDTLAERKDFILRGYAYREAELALKRTRLSERVAAGDRTAMGELTKGKKQQQELADRKERSLTILEREPELIVPGEIEFLAHALVVPSADPEDRRCYDREIERVAVRVALGYEGERGCSVRDVSLPELALDAGLEAYPGFDLLSWHPSGEERAIEVKGRASVGDIEISENEWARACNLRERYWLYVVYDCATAHPRLLRIRDPFGKLLTRRKGGVVIEEEEVFDAAES